MTKMNKMREQLAQEFIKALSENTLPWERGWNVYRNHNVVTSKPYRGVNTFWLSMVADIQGYEDPRWCTFKQAKDKGWHVKKGEKGTSVEFWSLYDKEMKRNITQKEAASLRNRLGKEEFEERVRLVSKTYIVFNGEQIEGIPPFEKKEPVFDEKEAVKFRDQVIREFSLDFFEGGNRAFYRPSNDSVTMPAVRDFKNEYTYLSTFLHEVSHSTGHSKRLNRDMSGGFGTPDYAKEELRAEISSAFTSQMLGIRLEHTEESLNNHKAYIQNWMQVIENDPNELFRAIKDAEGISDYIIETAKLESYVQQLEEPLEQKREDSLTIFQVKKELENEYLFQSMERLEKQGKTETIRMENYNIVYEEPYSFSPGSMEEQLEEIFARFNQSHPEEYKGHSLSVGDVVALQQNGQTRYFFVDRVGFIELKDFEKAVSKEIDYPTIRTVGEMESRNNIPEDERLTTWFGDYLDYERKPGVTNEQIQQKYNEIVKYSRPLLSISEAATVRLITKGRHTEKADGFDPVFAKVANLLNDYMAQGAGMEEILSDKISEIDQKAGVKDIRYTKNLICSIVAIDHESYEEYMNMDHHTEKSKNDLESMKQRETVRKVRAR